MSLLDDRRKIGQRIVAGFPGPAMSPEFVELVRRHKVANVILFRANVEDRAQLRRLCGEIQELVRRETGAPAFITIDQEGGMVTRLSPDCANVPGAMALSAGGGEEDALRAGRVTGRQLRALGVNFDLAPDMDVNSNPANPVIGVRSYSDDPARVARMGTAMMRGLLEEGVLCCAKHFPGIGGVMGDSHEGAIVSEKTLDELRDWELAPFKAAIDAGVPMVMVGHLTAPNAFGSDVPASLNPAAVTDLLRGELGFQGLVITDSLSMGAVGDFCTPDQAGVAALEAGADLVLMPEDFAAAYQGVLDAVSEGALSEERIDQSVLRIVKAKLALAGE